MRGARPRPPNLPLASVLVRGHHRLSQAETAVPGRNLVLGEYLESRGGQRSNKVRSQIKIVEGSTAQAYTVERSAIPQGFGDADESCDQPVVKLAADFGRGRLPRTSSTSASNMGRVLI